MTEWSVMDVAFVEKGIVALSVHRYEAHWSAVVYVYLDRVGCWSRLHSERRSLGYFASCDGSERNGDGVVVYLAGNGLGPTTDRRMPMTSRASDARFQLASCRYSKPCR